MVRPRWATFEVVGTSQEIEAVYQSLRGYGIVDLVSSSGALMMPSDDSKEASGTVHC